ncbi:MAG: SURF1 family protein [Pseudonocardiaceae bacterium]|nr:SURF1 family protein [Pseudonocardiaceae bacterium]
MRWKFLLQPGWLALTLVVLLFATACYTLLAPWQFGRHDERSAQNAALQRSFDTQAKPLGEVLPNRRTPGPGEQWEQVRLRGSYLPSGETLARLRTVAGEAAFEVLTPFRLASGDVVLVNRGYIRPERGTRVPDYAGPPRGQVELVARVRGDETDPQGRAAFTNASTDGHRQMYAIDSATVARATGLKINPGYLQLDANQPGVLRPMPLPQLESGPFLSYALQWIAFGTMALLGWLYFTWREARPGGALSTPLQGRKSVAEILAEDEEAERTDSTERRERGEPQRSSLS